MAQTTKSPARPVAASPAAMEEARRLFRSAERSETGHDRGRYVELLKGYLAYVEEHRWELVEGAAEIARHLDDTAMAFYRLSQADLAARSVDVGLVFAPRSAPLLHHKALILLAQNRDVEKVVPLLEQATAIDPHDKTIWSTLGDALRLSGRTDDAAAAYLRAQQLDVTSTQYIEKALRVAPSDPAALRMRLELAKAHGGDRQALDACEKLLASSPNDPALLLARVELLAALGDIPQALAAATPARAALPDDPHLALLLGNLQRAGGHVEEAVSDYRMAAKGTSRLNPHELQRLAEQAESTGQADDLAIDVRQALLAREPRNLANLHSLRRLAVRSRRPDLGIAACRGILEVSPGNLEATRALAEFQIAAGALDEGFATYRTLFEHHPHEVAEIRKAIEAARTAKRPDLLAEFSRAAVEADPSDLAARESLGEALTLSGDHEGALEVYDSLADARPDEIRYAVERKRLLTELGRSSSLPGIYDQLFQLDPSRSDIAVERGELYLAQAREKPAGSPEREHAARMALVSFERASTDPLLAERSLLGLARASELAGDQLRAVRAFREFLARPSHGDDAATWKELGHALRAVGQWTEAEAAYDRALSFGLEDSDLLWGHVEVLASLNREPQAIRLLDALLKREPANPTYLRKKGQLLMRVGRRPEGLDLLKGAVDHAGADPQVRFDVAAAMCTDGAYADAIDYYRKGVELDPKSRPGRLGLAETLNLAGRYNEAIPVVDALLGEDSNDLAAWKVRSDACRALGRTADLEYSLRAILLLEPGHSPALLEKYRLHLAQGQKQEAYDCFVQFLGTAGPGMRDPVLLVEAGDLASELGRVDEGNRAYERAAELDPKLVPTVAVRRARLQLTAARPDQALEVLDGGMRGATAAPEEALTVALLRGEILMALERTGEAEAIYRAVLSSDPRSVPATLGLGRSLLDQGKHADAKAMLAEALPKLPASAQLYLLLAEAESGLGSIPNAVAAAQRGTEAVPGSMELWRRLGELHIARAAWNEASGAYARAIALDASNPELLLRAGFVSEKLGHPNEAIALYDRAAQVAPANKFAWSSRGLALLAIGRSDEAVASFDRALALDSDFDAARQGKKAATEKTREAEIDRLGREALLLEARLHRAVTKNDLFVTLHVPYDLLDPTLALLSRDARVDLARLTEEEMHQLENESCQIVTAALDRRAEGVERRGFTLADVAVLSPANRSLSSIQRLFGYLRAVLEADLRPENLRLTPDVEELARRALVLPPAQRTLFQLVRTLHVGIFKARLIKAVEAGGSAVHAPLPSLDLGAYTPEFRSRTPADAIPADDRSEADEAAAPPPTVEPPEAAAPVEAVTVHSAPAHGGTGGPRCIGCGGLASVIHSCGAPVCAHCIVEFRTCPKCHLPIDLPTPSAASPPPPAPPPSARSGSGRGTLHAIRQAISRPKPKVHGAPEPHHASAEPSPPPPAEAPVDTPEPPPRPSRPKEKPDDEPRL